MENGTLTLLGELTGAYTGGNYPRMPGGQGESATVGMQKEVEGPALGGVGGRERLPQGSGVCVPSVMREKGCVPGGGTSIEGFIW